MGWSCIDFARNLVGSSPGCDSHFVMFTFTILCDNGEFGFGLGVDRPEKCIFDVDARACRRIWMDKENGYM